MLGGVAHGMASAFRSFNRTYRSKNAFRSRGDSTPSVPAGPPRNFVRYKDPKGIFELNYPSDWSLQKKEGVQVSSERLGSFARVDIRPDTPHFWDHLKQDFAEAGEEVEYLTRNGSHPIHVRGKVRAKGMNFMWDAYAYALGNNRLILSLGNVVDPRRSKAIERYEDSVLAAIRRYFRAREK